MQLRVTGYTIIGVLDWHSYGVAHSWVLIYLGLQGRCLTCLFMDPNSFIAWDIAQSGHAPMYVFLSLVVILS